MQRSAFNRSLLAGLSLLAIGTFMPGCETTQYNGAWSFGGNRQEARSQKQELVTLQREVDQTRTQQANNQPSEAQIAQNAQQQYEQYLASQGVVNGATQSTTASSSDVMFAASNEQPNQDPRTLGLYGSLPTSTDVDTTGMDTSSNTTQVSFTQEGADFDPEIDLTGKRFVFASTRHRKTADIYLQPVGGTTVTQVTNDPANDVMPTFSPDGQSVAFASDRGGNWDIWIVDLKGGKPVQVTNSPTQDLHPSFSPDGSQLIFCSFGSRSGQWELWIVDVNNPAKRRQVGYGLFPVWSPVENKIVFQRARQRGNRLFSVWTIDLDDGEAKRPTEIAASSNAAVITPAWSPDGKYLTFSTVLNAKPGNVTEKPKQADVWMVDLAGKQRVNLTRSQFSDVQPTWGPDGTIYFVSNRGKNGIENVWQMRPDKAEQFAREDFKTKDATAKTPEPTGEGATVIAPDGN